MTQRNIDDVTGKVIESGRSFQLKEAGFGSLVCETQDVDAFLKIVRDKIDGKNASPPLDIAIITWTHNPLTQEYRKYEPEPEPEPEPAPSALKPGSFNFAMALPEEVRTPSPFVYLRPPSVPSSAKPVALANGRIVPERERDELVARLDKTRAKFTRALAAACGCNDPDAHERNLP